MCGVQSQVPSAAELAVRVRQSASRPGDLADALADGRLIRTWAMRGTLHLLTPEDAGSFLSLLAAGRSWEKPSWVRYFGMGPREHAQLREAVCAILDGAVLTREELIEAVTARDGLGHIGEELRSGWGTLLKPLAWQGDLCYGPSRGTRVTFMRPDQASARWAGVPEPDAAAPTAILAYLRAYGPATVEEFSNWISRGRVAKRSLRAWFAALGDRVAEVEVEGEHAYVAAEDLDALAAATASSAVRLLPGFDGWVLGPGTEDTHVIPPGRRGDVSRQSGWIAPLVLVGGVVAGTWGQEDGAIRIAWFRESGRVPRGALDAEVARLSSILGRELRPEVAIG